MIKESKLIGTKVSMPYGWHGFKVGDLFDKIVSNSDWIDDVVKISDVKQRPDGYVDGISATTSNNQRSMYVKVNNPDAILHNKLSSTANADGMMFYQPNDFVVVQDAYALELKNDDYADDKNVLLFLQGAQKRNMAKYNYSLKSGWARVKEDVVILPVTQDGQPDYGWMSSYIRELENQRIRELENQRIRELDTYLQVTGLDDTLLTDNELQVLEQWRQHEKFGGTLLTKHFKVGDLFILKNTKAYNELPDDMVLSSNDNANVPFVTTQFNNNGIVGFSELQPLNSGNRITYSDTTTGDAIFYQPNDYIGRSHVIYMEPNFDGFNKYVAMFVIALIRKQTSGRFDYGKKLNKQAMYDMVIELPMTADDTPDYEFMQTFIRAQEKLVMQNLAEFRQRQIDTTRQII